MMTKKDIKFYQDEIVRYMEMFGLGRWSIQFEDWDEFAGDYKESDALSESWMCSRFAKFSINPRKTFTKNQISRAALHEVTHILTARLRSFAFEIEPNEEYVSEEMEAIAKSMERAFFGPVE